LSLLRLNKESMQELVKESAGIIGAELISAAELKESR
jgi:hypothetical protein